MHVKKAHVELVATNVKSHSANGLNQLIAGAQDLLPATINTAAIAPVVAAHADAMQWHRDAGTYFCNEAFFRTAYQIRAANITAPSTAGSAAVSPPPLLPATFMHLPPPTVISVAQGTELVAAVAQAMSLKPVSLKPCRDAAARRGAAQTRVLLGGFGGRLGPDRGGAAVLALNGTCVGERCYDALIANSADALAQRLNVAAAAGGVPWAAVLLVAEQSERLQHGMALQAVGYARAKSDGDEADDVLPSTAHLRTLNPSPRASKVDTARTWTRDNSDFGTAGATYYQTLQTLRNISAAAGARDTRALMASLPFADSRPVAEDAQVLSITPGHGSGG